MATFLWGASRLAGCQATFIGFGSVPAVLRSVSGGASHTHREAFHHVERGKRIFTRGKSWQMLTSPLLESLATSFHLSNAAERHLCERQTNEPIDVTDFGRGGATNLQKCFKIAANRFFASGKLIYEANAVFFPSFLNPTLTIKKERITSSAWHFIMKDCKTKHFSQRPLILGLSVAKPFQKLNTFLKRSPFVSVDKNELPFLIITAKVKKKYVFLNKDLF